MQFRRVVVPGASYFFTVVTHDRLPILRDEATIKIWEMAVARVQQRHPFEVEAQVILPDHIHAIWTLPSEDFGYSLRWRLVKEAFTRSYMKGNFIPELSHARTVRGERAVWQRRFWEHLLRDDTDFARHLDYIHLNPVHHGFVGRPGDWPFSTFKSWEVKGAYEPNWGTDEMAELPSWAKRHE